MRSLRVVVADDEPLARLGLVRLLEHHRDVEIVAECRDGDETIEVVRREKPDLLLLDVQMPGRNGFEVLEALRAEERPATIFVTAYDAHALQAFEVHAVDYVLKPVQPERFDAALQHARELVRRAHAPLPPGSGQLPLEPGQLPVAEDRLPLAPGQLPLAEGRLSLSTEDIARLAGFLGTTSGATYLERFLVRTTGGLSVIPAREVRYLEADGDYVRLHRAGRPELMRATLQSLEARLDPHVFVRVHRSFLIRLDEVREVRGSSGGDGTLVLQDGTELPLSRTYRERLLEALDQR